MPVSEDDVRAFALGLPGAFERESYGGRPSWRTQPRMFAWIRDDPEALVVWVESVELKEMLIASEPRKFFTTPHYDGQAVVLVNLNAVDTDEAAELITDSWRRRAPRSLLSKHPNTAIDKRSVLMADKPGALETSRGSPDLGRLPGRAGP